MNPTPPWKVFKPWKSLFFPELQRLEIVPFFVVLFQTKNNIENDLWKDWKIAKISRLKICLVYIQPFLYHFSRHFLSGADACESAILLTEYWRKVYGNSERWRNNCDLQTMIDQGRPWFRFVGAAGTRLANECTPVHGCGTDFTIWSDAVMPSIPGEEQEIMVKARSTSNCAAYQYKVLVKKCSYRDDGYAYKFVDENYQCRMGFCGMDWWMFPQTGIDLSPMLFTFYECMCSKFYGNLQIFLNNWNHES